MCSRKEFWIWFRVGQRSRNVPFPFWGSTIQDLQRADNSSSTLLVAKCTVFWCIWNIPTLSGHTHYMLPFDRGFHFIERWQGTLCCWGGLTSFSGPPNKCPCSIPQQHICWLFKAHHRGRAHWVENGYFKVYLFLCYF